MSKYFYGTSQNQNISTKDICNAVNSLPSNQCTTHCYDVEGGGIYVKTSENTEGLRQKIMDRFEIVLSKARSVK